MSRSRTLLRALSIRTPDDLEAIRERDRQLRVYIEDGRKRLTMPADDEWMLQAVCDRRALLRELDRRSRREP